LFDLTNRFELFQTRAHETEARDMRAHQRANHHAYTLTYPFLLYVITTDRDIYGIRENKQSELVMLQN